MQATKTEEKVAESKAQPNGSALATIEQPMSVDLVPVGGTTSAITWTRERVDLLKKQIVPSGITDDEFSIFLLQCKRTELDPLIGEAFCVPRNVKIKGRTPNEDRWVTKHVFQAAEQGMSARADRFSDFEGMKAAAVYANDTIEIDQEAGTVLHKSKPGKDRGPLIGAWARALRRGRHTPVEWVDMASYQLDTPQWKSKAPTMIVKCARAAAYRRAYPNVFGGVMTDAEMTEEEEIGQAGGITAEQKEHDGKSRTERVAEKVAQRVAPPSSSAAPAPSGPTVGFGAHKTKLIAGLSDPEISESLTEGRNAVSAQPGAKWAARVTHNIAELEAEQARRYQERSKKAKAAAISDAEVVERQPGDDEDADIDS